MKRLPIAQTVFHRIIEENYLYVDKTKFIKDLDDGGHTYYFLSRPRHFGKSLFIDTLKAAYSGKEELFKGLYLEKNWYWSKKHPVVKIDLGAGDYATREDLKKSLRDKLSSSSEDYDIKLQAESLSGKFGELIKRLYEKFNIPVVVLIDEYDKPILDNLTKPNVAEIRDELADFYSVLKPSSDFLKMVFITGVSRFSKTSIFSKLNNLTDLTLNESYADICGYKQEDLEKIFVDYLHDVDLKKVKEWYDGYNFGGSNLYNPYDVLMFLWEKKYKSYWFQTGTPTFLMELIRQKEYYLPRLENISIDDDQMAEFEIPYIDLEVLLFQSGYLTIESSYEMDNTILYKLKIPNKEVQKGLYSYLLRSLYTRPVNNSDRIHFVEKIFYAIRDQKPQDLESAFTSFFASIPNDWYRKNNIARFEGFYTSMFYIFFMALGMDVVAEDFTHKGRIDLTVKRGAIYIFEFKMKGVGQLKALQQIKKQNYAEKYKSEGQPIYLIGIEFDEKTRNLSEFEWEKL